MPFKFCPRSSPDSADTPGCTPIAPGPRKIGRSVLNRPYPDSKTDSRSPAHGSRTKERLPGWDHLCPPYLREGLQQSPRPRRSRQAFSQDSPRFAPPGQGPQEDSVSLASPDIMEPRKRVVKPSSRKRARPFHKETLFPIRTDRVFSIRKISSTTVMPLQGSFSPWGSDFRKVVTVKNFTGLAALFETGGTLGPSRSFQSVAHHIGKNQGKTLPITRNLQKPPPLTLERAVRTLLISCIEPRIEGAVRSNPSLHPVDLFDWCSKRAEVPPEMRKSTGIPASSPPDHFISHPACKERIFIRQRMSSPDHAEGNARYIFIRFLS